MSALPEALQDELALLLADLDGLQRTRYLSIAATCVLLYDFLLTFDQEVSRCPLPSVACLIESNRIQVEYFWKAGRWSLSRVLFFLVRSSTCVLPTSFYS